jgi:hypothetical protein
MQGKSQLAIITDVGPGGPDNSLPGAPGAPDNSLPSIPGPVDPGYGYPLPPVIDNGLPPIPGVWPPSRPTYPVGPEHLPTVPGVWPNPPNLGDRPDNSLPPVPAYPSHPIYRPPVAPDNSLPIPPGSVWPPLPPSVTGVLLALVWIVGVGYRWVTIDASATLPVPTPPIAPGGSPTQPIAPTPSPKA